jgi:putative (di)nucleoside polyphosphate hydrolase
MKTGTQFFRAGVGAVITDREGSVLAFERSDISKAWQMVQGGLEDGEEPIEAALREIEEETGIPRSRITLMAEYPEPLVYELPESARSPKTGRGQVQYWFLFALNGDRAAIDLGNSREFKRWRWMSLAELITLTVRFRVPTYRRLEDFFSPFLLRTPPHNKVSA